MKLISPYEKGGSELSKFNESNSFTSKGCNKCFKETTCLLPSKKIWLKNTTEVVKSPSQRSDLVEIDSKK